MNNIPKKASSIEELYAMSPLICLKINDGGPDLIVKCIDLRLATPDMANELMGLDSDDDVSDYDPYIPGEEEP